MSAHRPPRAKHHTRTILGLALVAAGAGASARGDDLRASPDAGEPAAVTTPPAPAPPAPAPPAPEPRVDAAGAARDHKAGLERMRRGAVEDAIPLLRGAAGKDPSSALIANDLGFALARSGEPLEAEAQYRRALALDPKRVYAYVNLADLVGVSADRWRRRTEVLDLLAKGLTVLGDRPREKLQLQLAIADFERRVGRLADARRALAPVLAGAAPVAVRKRALDLSAAIQADEAAQALDDWPEGSLSPEQTAALREAETLVSEARAAAALSTVDRVVATRPTAVEPRFVRARVLEALGRYDEATRDLSIVLQVRPSHARAWRRLGTILAVHGGALEAERADEALRRALALEPSWDDLRALRRTVAEKRRASGEPRPPTAAAPPSAKALALFDEAQRWMALDAPEMAEAALREALVGSPSYVDAAVSLYAVAREVPETVPQALWEDGDGLARLAAQLLGLRKDDATVALVRPWVERAVAKGSAEGRFQRALLRSDAGDRAGALEDLGAYVASAVAPPRLSEARALRVSLLGPEQRRRPAIELARLHLLADRPEDADRALGAPCREGLDSGVLVELGRVREYVGDLSRALACYRLAESAAPAARPDSAPPTALVRLARLAARMPASELAGVLEPLRTAERARVPEASLALARLAESKGSAVEALARFDAFLRSAPGDDPLRVGAAQAASELRAREDSTQRAQRERRRSVLTAATISAGVLLAAALVLAVLRRLRRSTVERALRRRPELYPEVARIVAELRHDVIKHRASALGLLAAPDTAPAIRAEVARLMREPKATSRVIADAYARLQSSAAGLGLRLRPLAADPVFGGLARDLARAEALLGPEARSADRATLAELDTRIRERHASELGRLLGAGPRTRLDPGLLWSWVRAVEAWHAAAAPRYGTGASWTMPELHFQDTDLEVPVAEPVLATVFMNLLRNAAAAVQGSEAARVRVQVGEERDATGRRLVALLVSDSSPAQLSSEDIERRDGQRGLGIVRDLVRTWGGHVLVREQPAPFTKAVGAVFPAATLMHEAIAPELPS